jgi:hypothetical protein
VAAGRVERVRLTNSTVLTTDVRLPMTRIAYRPWRITAVTVAIVATAETVAAVRLERVGTTTRTTATGLIMAAA